MIQKVQKNAPYGWKEIAREKKEISANKYGAENTGQELGFAATLFGVVVNNQQYLFLFHRLVIQTRKLFRNFSKQTRKHTLTDTHFSMARIYW